VGWGGGGGGGKEGDGVGVEGRAVVVGDVEGAGLGVVVGRSRSSSGFEKGVFLGNWRFGGREAVVLGTNTGGRRWVARCWGCGSGSAAGFGMLVGGWCVACLQMEFKVVARRRVCGEGSA
jgi:hypothetical protein